MIANIYGYGLDDSADPTFYDIKDAIPTFNSKAYGFYVGTCYSISFAPALLFVGHLTEQANRKMMVGVSCFLWGALTAVNYFISSNIPLFIVRFFIGLVQSFSGPATYSLITDYFPKEYRVKAFFAFAVFQQLGDTFSYLTITIISKWGFRNAWLICGAFGMVAGLLTIFTLYEPPRHDRLEVEIPEEDQDKDEAALIETFVEGSDYQAIVT